MRKIRDLANGAVSAAISPAGYVPGPGMILVVDAETTERDILCSQLEPLGHQILTAASGDEALALIARHPLDLILINLHLPDIDGLELCRRLKQDREKRTIPLIAIGAADEHSRAMAAGASEVLLIPVRTPVLLTRVQSCLLIRQLTTRLMELEDLNESLVNMVIHDLNGPLMGVTGFLEMIRMSPSVDGPVRQHADRAAQAAAAILSLVKNLRDISRLEAGTYTLNVGMVMPGRMMRDLLTACAPRMQQRKQLLRARGADGMLCMWDEDLIRRVMQNLLDNAVEYAPEGAIIEVDWGQESDVGWFRVANPGVVIPADYHERIFDKFTQYNSSRGRRGCGLGLAFARLAVRVHGGSITIESPIDDRGEGAAFTVRLPRRVATGTI